MRDSRTGYFNPVRYGIGVWPDGRVVGASPSSPLLLSSSASSGTSGRHSGQGTILGVVHMDLGSSREIFGNGDWGSTQNFDTNLIRIVVWPGEPFSLACGFGLGLTLFPRLPCSYMDFLPEMYGPNSPHMDFFLENVTRTVHMRAFERKIDQRF